MAFCANCGHEISDQAAACPQCGHPAANAAVAMSGGIRYAGWGSRAVAAILDAIIVSIPAWIVMTAIGAGWAASNQVAFDPETNRIVGDSSGFYGTFIVSWLILMAIGIAYRVILEGGAKGQTVGKMVMKIRVADAASGGSIGYGRAFVRWLVASILWIAFYIPGIIDILFPLWDQRKQSLHDKAASSVVVTAT